MAKIPSEDILAYLDEATILELNDLVKAIEEKFGVTAAAPVAVAAVAAEEDAAPTGPTSVNVVLASVGDSKVGVIKVVREVTGLGLVDAKGIVDKAPVAVKENVPVAEAEEIKKKLMEAGATVEFK